MSSPVQTFLERADIISVGAGYQVTPYTQYTEPMTTAKADRKEDWWIVARLLEEMGLKAPATDGDGFDDLNKVLAFSNLSIDALKEADDHTVLLPPSDPADVYEKCIQHSHKRSRMLSARIRRNWSL